MISESKIAILSIDNTPYAPQQLAEGQSPFDLDRDSMKWHGREDLSQDIKDWISALDGVAKDLEVLNHFPQESPETPARPSKLFGALSACSC
jgi:hypothetical protein